MKQVRSTTASDVTETRTVRTVVTCPMPYNGRGWTETCAQILHRFPSQGVHTTVVLPRATQAFAHGIDVAPAFGPLTRMLPWRVLTSRAEAQSTRTFRAAIAAADPRSTVVYVWPGTPSEQVDIAHAAGLIVVRQMINCTMATAKGALDEAYARRGLAPSHGITDEHAEIEAEELRQCDLVLAPNHEVELSLVQPECRPPRWCLRRSVGLRHALPRRLPVSGGRTRWSSCSLVLR